jgi:hypothetical protein
MNSSSIIKYEKSVTFEKPPLKAWKECKTLLEMVTCVVGNSRLIATYAIEEGSSKVYDFSRATIKILHLDDMTQFVLAKLKMGYHKLLSEEVGYALGNIIGKSLNAACKLQDKIVTYLRLKGSFTYVSNKLAAVIPKIDKLKTYISTNVFNQRFFDAIATSQKLAKKCLQSSYKLAKTLSNYTIVPIYNNLLAPLGKYISEKSKTSESTKSVSTSKFKPLISGLKKLSNYTIVPLYKNILSPVCSILGDIGCGILQGCIAQPKPNNEVDKKVEAKEMKKS